jgi:hypothetical protein
MFAIEPAQACKDKINQDALDMVWTRLFGNTMGTLTQESAAESYAELLRAYQGKEEFVAQFYKRMVRLERKADKQEHSIVTVDFLLGRCSKNLVNSLLGQILYLVLSLPAEKISDDTRSILAGGGDRYDPTYKPDSRMIARSLPVTTLTMLLDRVETVDMHGQNIPSGAASGKKTNQEKVRANVTWATTKESNENDDSTQSRAAVSLPAAVTPVRRQFSEFLSVKPSSVNVNNPMVAGLTQWQKIVLAHQEQYWIKTLKAKESQPAGTVAAIQSNADSDEFTIVEGKKSKNKAKKEKKKEEEEKERSVTMVAGPTDKCFFCKERGHVYQKCELLSMLYKLKEESGKGKGPG